jgi:hypothetical protein
MRLDPPAPLSIDPSAGVPVHALPHADESRAAHTEALLQALAHDVGPEIRRDVRISQPQDAHRFAARMLLERLQRAVERRQRQHGVAASCTLRRHHGRTQRERVRYVGWLG